MLLMTLKSGRRGNNEYTSTQDIAKMQCLVTGKIEPIARLHRDIKGVRDAQAKGAALVSFNLDAFTSYRRDQGENAPVSQSVAAGYVEALNYLLSDQNPHRKIYLGDTTVVYWADTADRRYASAFFALLSPENQPANTTKILRQHAGVTRALNRPCALWPRRSSRASRLIFRRCVKV
jgi:hypothetical protein